MEWVAWPYSVSQTSDNIRENVQDKNHSGDELHIVDHVWPII